MFGTERYFDGGWRRGPIPGIFDQQSAVMADASSPRWAKLRYTGFPL